MKNIFRLYFYKDKKNKSGDIGTFAFLAVETSQEIYNFYNVSEEEYGVEILDNPEILKQLEKLQETGETCRELFNRLMEAKENLKD